LYTVNVISLYGTQQAQHAMAKGQNQQSFDMLLDLTQAANKSGATEPQGSQSLLQSSQEWIT